MRRTRNIRYKEQQHISNVNQNSHGITLHEGQRKELTTLVASRRPPRPTSRIATSTCNQNITRPQVIVESDIAMKHANAASHPSNNS